MENFESLCILLNSGDPDEISQAQTEINRLVETMPASELVDFLISEIESQSSIYPKFTSMIMLSQIDLTDSDTKKTLATIFSVLSTSNISLRNTTIKLFSKCLINNINTTREDDSDDTYLRIINQLTEQIPNLSEDDSILHQSIVSVLFSLLDYYSEDTTISLFICSYLFQHMIEAPNDENILNHFIKLFSYHISFLFKMFLTDEQIAKLFTFIETLLNDDNFKNTVYLFLLKIAEFDYQQLFPIIDTFFQISLNDLNEQNEDYEMKLSILNIWHLIFKNDRYKLNFQSSYHIISDGIENLMSIIENEKIREMRFDTEWNESIACFKCLKAFSKCQNSLISLFFIEYLTNTDFSEISILLVEILITSSPHELILENISDFLELIEQSFSISEEEGNDSIIFIHFSTIKCIRKMVKYLPDCLPLFFPFAETIIDFIEGEAILALEALSTLSHIFKISPFEEKEKYVNLIFEISENLPPFISSHSIDSLIPIISTINDSDFFVQTTPVLLKLLNEAKDELFLDSLLNFLQKFVLNAGESISSFIPSIMEMLIQFIVENHSIVSVLAVGTVSYVSSPELIEPYISDIFNILNEIILNDGMDDKSLRNQCLSSLSLVALHFDLSAYLSEISELTIKIIENIETNEWNNLDFSSAAFLIDLYTSIIINQNEIEESILAHIFDIISHQISLIDFTLDDENIQFSEISFFLEISTKFITQFFINCTDLLSEEVFDLAMLLIDNATQLPFMNLSIKETIYDFYALLSRKFPDQLCTIFSQNEKVESFILNMMSSSEFISILSNKALRIQQK